MKNYLTIITLLFSFAMTSQVSVSTSKIMKSSNLDLELIENFKKTTTVFVLRDNYTIEEYNKMLESFWDVTPFKVVLEKDYNFQEFLSTEYSIASMNYLHTDKDISKMSGNAANTIFFKFDIRVFNEKQIEKIKLKLASTKKGKDEEIGNYIAYNSDDVAHVFMYPILNKEVGMAIYYKKFDKVSDWASSDESAYFNYSLGYLKNYFQKINKSLKENKGVGLFEEVLIKSELKKLKNQDLIIPKYMIDMPIISEKDLGKAYSYSYTFQDSETIDKRVMEGEEFYYLQHTIINSDRFIEIVNAKTGEVIFKNVSISPLAFKFKKKHIELINDAISKS